MAKVFLRKRKRPEPGAAGWAHAPRCLSRAEFTMLLLDDVEAVLTSLPYLRSQFATFAAGVRARDRNDSKSGLASLHFFYDFRQSLSICSFFLDFFTEPAIIWH